MRFGFAYLLLCCSGRFGPGAVVDPVWDGFFDGIGGFGSGMGIAFRRCGGCFRPSAVVDPVGDGLFDGIGAFSKIYTSIRPFSQR